MDSRELRRFVVRISGPAGSTLGTGFFAAPGWVVTCAHVVGDLREAMVTPASPRVSLESAAWPVVARSDLPPAGWRSAFWPYPDLAVLRADGEVEHPCPLLEARDPAGECYSWGFPQVEQGIEPGGGPASFDFEGVTGGDFLQLKAGQTAPGISGAPLVCPSLRAVVGVVAVSRDIGSALGGWASPLSALLAGGEGVPEDLTGAGEEIRKANRAAVIRYRREWNAVLPVEAGDALDQPWAQFTRGPRSVPSSLLRADYGVVPYLFRDAELDGAVAWCEQADWARPMAVMRVMARGGTGKTRFAIELCKRLGSAWAAGLWPGNGNGNGAGRLPWPRLVVIDYAEEAQAASLRDRLDALARHATGLAPVRVLLLTRARTGQAADALTEIENDPGTPATLRRVLDHAEDNPVASLPLTSGQREALYHAAVARFAAAWCPAVGATEIGLPGVPDLSHPRYEVTLEVLFEALAAALDQCGEGFADDQLSGGGGPPAERVLAHEEKYWRLTAPAEFRGDAGLLRECAGLATLAGAGSQQQADALLSIPARLAGPDAAAVRRTLTAWLSSMYDGAAVLNPVRPDRLGEELVRRVLSGQDDDGHAMLGAVLGLESADQLERCLDVLARLSAYHAPTASTAAAAVSRTHIGLTLRAEQQSHGAAGRPGRMALASAYQRLLTPTFCNLVVQRLADAEPGNTTYARDLSVSFERLADLAVAAGQGERARELYERSLAIAQRLADAEPGNTTYARDLSVSFERLADLARAAGQGDQAQIWVFKALDIRRELVHTEPHRLDLAEELAYVLYLSMMIGADPAAAAGEAASLLQPFVQFGHVTPRAQALLDWAYSTR
ncbi:MAG TPA: trypsin-like peptidase domain-containing protein [Streptosporangiaceae bacterium]|nr:trypsin-like peptidase domain-containing protein [Streptosporangiaceae bacterium]